MLLVLRVGALLHKSEAEVRALPADEFVRWCVYLREYAPKYNKSLF